MELITNKFQCIDKRAPCKCTRLFYSRSIHLKVMADGRKEGTAFLLAGPAGGLEVDAPWVGIVDLALPAEFEEAAGAFDGRAWGIPACVGGLALLPAS